MTVLKQLLLQSLILQQRPQALPISHSTGLCDNSAVSTAADTAGPAVPTEEHVIESQIEGGSGSSGAPAPAKKRRRCLGLSRKISDA